MPDIAQGNNAKLILAPGEVYRVTAVGTATVQAAYGAPSGATTVTAASRDFGPYDAHAKLVLTAVSGPVNYQLRQGMSPVLVDDDKRLITPDGDVVGGGVVEPTNNYRLRCIVGRQVGVVVDSGGRGFNGYAAAGNDQLWANRGYFSSKTTAAGTDGGVLFSPRAFDWDLNGPVRQSFIMSFLVKAAAPAAAIRFLGNCIATNGVGFAMTANTDGTLTARAGDGAQAYAGPATPVVFDGTEHYVFISVDSATSLCSVYVDSADIGVTSMVGASGSPTPLAGSTKNTTNQFRIGNAGDTASVGTHAVQMNAFQCLTVEGPLPANINELRKKLQADPHYLVTSEDLANRTAGAGDSIAPSVAGADAATRSLYRYLKTFCGKPSFLVGGSESNDSPGIAPANRGTVADYIRMSGKAPAIMNWEYVDKQQGDDGQGSTGKQRQANLLAAMRAHAAAGGINFLHDHPGHPVTGGLSKSPYYSGAATGTSWDTTAGGLAAINTGGAQEAQFLAYLDRLAEFIQLIGTPVVLRPFHEMNGGWFWWGGASNAATLKAVWVKMYNYLVTTKGLTNVLFSWNINGTDTSGDISDNAVTAYSTWYPGDAYVDIVSIDYYNNRSWSASTFWSLGRTILRAGVDALQAIAAPGGKPVLFAEAGYQYASANKPDLWEMVGSDFASVFPDCAAFVMWFGDFGPSSDKLSAPSVSRMFAKDYCITLDKSDGAAYTS